MKFDVKVKEVMNKDIVKLDAMEKIKKAAGIMKKKKIGSVLVTKNEDIIGILTTSDIVYKHVADSYGEKLEDVMTKELVTIDPEKTIEEAARLMVEKNIEKLPVAKDGKIIAIITSNDILKVEPALFEILLEKMKIEEGEINNK